MIFLTQIGDMTLVTPEKEVEQKTDWFLVILVNKNLISEGSQRCL